MKEDVRPETTEPTSPGEWKILVREIYRQTFGELEPPDRREFSPLEEWQCRISGGALLKFLRFVSDRGRRRKDEVLEEIGRTGKILLCFTDSPGAVACHDVLRMFRPASLWLPFEHWERIAVRPGVADPELRRHFEYSTSWIAGSSGEAGGDSEGTTDELWLHRESFRLAPKRSRSAVHHWRWNGRSLDLVRQGVEAEEPPERD